MTLIRFCIVNPVGLCVNNSPDSGIIEQSSITRIPILNSRGHNSYTALNLLLTNSTFPQLFDTWVKCYQMSTRSKCFVHLFMEAYLTSRCFSIQVDFLFLLYICAMTFFCLCIGTSHQNNMLIEKWSCGPLKSGYDNFRNQCVMLQVLLQVLVLTLIGSLKTVSNTIRS